MAVLASTDELTGTFNRREFVQESNQTLQHFSHARVPFTIGILDIDHFKQLNDCTTVPYKQIIIATGEGAKAALSAFDYIIRSGV